MPILSLFRLVAHTLHQQRPRPHYTHIPFQHIPQPRQTIEAGGAQKATKGHDALRIWQGLARFIIGIAHRAELHHLERVAVQTGAGLAEEYGGTQLATDLNGNYQYNRREDCKRSTSPILTA